MSLYACIWKHGRKGYALELETENVPGMRIAHGMRQVSYKLYPDRLSARRAAHEAGAKPWNYAG